MVTQAQPSGIATIKPKRKYTKRKPQIALVKPKPKKALPKTARAYLNMLGMKADKESLAVTELIKLHSELVKKSSQEPAFAIPDPALNLPEITHEEVREIARDLNKPKTKTSWWPWFSK